MNLESETRKGYLISAKMKKVWAVEMELLKKLLEVCEKYHLRIWAEGGTLLGTIRHHGYIPWDDDIDMAMLREDYDKLQAIAKEEFKTPYFFQSGYTDLFPNGLSRIRKDGTAAIMDQAINRNYHQGIFIDIFPLDVMPDDEVLFKSFVKEKVYRKEQLLLGLESYYSFTNWKYDYLILKNKARIIIKGFHHCFSEYEHFIKQYNNTDNHRIAIISWRFDERYLRERIWYKDTLYLPFEDIKMPVPSGYDNILKKQFGDYMTPLKNPTEHGNFAILDSELSYKYYLPLLRNKKRRALRKEAFQIYRDKVKMIVKKIIHPLHLL